jgi:hypothetical protein
MILRRRKRASRRASGLTQNCASALKACTKRKREWRWRLQTLITVSFRRCRFCTNLGHYYRTELTLDRFYWQRVVVWPMSILKTESVKSKLLVCIIWVLKKIRIWLCVWGFKMSTYKYLDFNCILHVFLFFTDFGISWKYPMYFLEN